MKKLNTIGEAEGIVPIDPNINGQS